LVRTVVVVQAPLRSGALITADYALEQGRDLLVHRVGISGQRGAGSRRLAEQGAEIITGAMEILAGWGWSAGADPEEKKSAEIFRSLESGGELARLLELEMAGRVVYRSGRVFEREINGK
jgi:DNA processing protein